MSQPLAVGIARRDVTPPVGIYSGLWGAAEWDRIEGVHRPLTLTALWIGGGSGAAGGASRIGAPATGAAAPTGAAADGEAATTGAGAAGGDGVLLIAIDLGAWRRPQDERALRDAVLAATGLGEEAVLIHLTHTHASPSLCPDDAGKPGGELIVPYLETLRAAAVDAARDARADAVEATFAWGVGSCRLAASRDLPAGERDLVGYSPALPADDTVLLGRATAADGQVVATVLNYACHPTTLGWGSALVSPDYMGMARELVEQETGAPCLFAQGAEGDLAPREQYTGDPAVADRHGRSLGHAALAVLATLEPATAPPFVAAAPEAAAGAPAGDAAASLVVAQPAAVRATLAPLSLPLKDAEAVEALAERFWPDLDPRTRAARVERARWRRAQIGAGDRADYPVWAWRAGEAVVVAHPGEASSAFQIELRARHPRTPIVVLSLANGPIWTYLPLADRYERNVYQVWHTLFAAGCHERLVEHVDALIAGLLRDGE